MSWELHVLIILRFFFFVLSKLLLFTLKEEVVGAVWVHILGVVGFLKKRY